MTDAANTFTYTLVAGRGKIYLRTLFPRHPHREYKTEASVPSPNLDQIEFPVFRFIYSEGRITYYQRAVGCAEHRIYVR